MKEARKRIQECIDAKTTKLVLNQLKLFKLPDNLPNTLTHLHCSYNHLTELPSKLPDSLVVLNCCNNQISKLPDVFPSSLEVLSCANNQIEQLPDHLPESLKFLNCHTNNISKLPTKLPDSLEELYCSKNNIMHLSDHLPKRLRTLTCSHNPIEEFPNLPDSLTTLWFIETAISKFPVKLLKNDCEILCFDSDAVFFNSAIEVVKKYRWKKRFIQWIVCMRMRQFVDPDCSKIVASYV
ncbi:MAG: hypothetical protein Dasosvirus2_4 [Dasosvirus sp.]|uniref:Uncharacterized protein n=1 Tax=Dasosvirus sp. TaxID=2487764 RepID=A0A3G4ZR88_9VIRU|nr:MAG: hypothetical protein Dasosvirus2_4 [Dasosvirus sp.]